nr:chaperone protein ClpB1 [Tanacetum cinerariifolium]
MVLEFKMCMSITELNMKLRHAQCCKRLPHGKFIHMTTKALAASQELAMEAEHAQTTPFHVVTTLIFQTLFFN